VNCSHSGDEKPCLKAEDLRQLPALAQWANSLEIIILTIIYLVGFYLFLWDRPQLTCRQRWPDPHTPKVNLDSRALAAWHAYSAGLREHLTHVLKQPVEARLQILKPGVCVCIQVYETCLWAPFV
jgi:hypothetical protein